MSTKIMNFGPFPLLWTLFENSLAGAIHPVSKSCGSHFTLILYVLCLWIRRACCQRLGAPGRSGRRRLRPPRMSAGHTPLLIFMEFLFLKGLCAMLLPGTRPDRAKQTLAAGGTAFPPSRGNPPSRRNRERVAVRPAQTRIEKQWPAAPNGFWYFGK